LFAAPSDAVVEVLRILHAVEIAVGGPVTPRARDELQDADGVIPDRVGVVEAGVGVGDRLRAVRAVQRDADDRRKTLP